MKRALSLIVVFALIAGAGGRVGAQSVPLSINYQGYLVNSLGSPLPTGGYVLSFSIWNQESGGTKVWGPQVFDGAGALGHSPLVTVVTGAFNVALGPTDVNNFSILTAFSGAIGAGRFLEIQVSNSPPLSPRQSILSGAYALKSADSDALAGTNWGAVFNNGNPATGFIDGGRIASSSITASQIAPSAIGASHMQAGAVGANQIASGAVGRLQLANGAVGALQLTDGSVGPNHLSSGAALENLKSSGQSAIPSGGMVLSSNFNDLNLANAGFAKLGKVDLGDVWEARASGPITGAVQSVWTGSEALVWNGRSGGRYNPTLNTWTPISTINAPIRNGGFKVVWTGTEMLVWGGYTNGRFALVTTITSGGKYNPSSDSWTPIPSTAAPSGRVAHSAIWTGNEMIVWGGGPPQSSDPTYVSSPRNDGARYNPALDTWTVITNSTTVARAHHSAIWTGTEMIVWGGENEGSVFGVGNGARFEPASGAWTLIPTNQFSGARWGHTAIWTGAEMLVYGGWGFYSSDGVRFNPVNSVWNAIPEVSALANLLNHTTAWTGEEMIVFGNGIGARYNPSANLWTQMTAVGAPIARAQHGAVWTGNEMIIYGGTASGIGAMSDTLSYLPRRTVYLYQRF